jgi:hypothetical protein
VPSVTELTVRERAEKSSVWRRGNSARHFLCETFCVDFLRSERATLSVVIVRLVRNCAQERAIQYSEAPATGRRSIGVLDI